jgi:hypothetical protein
MGGSARAADVMQRIIPSTEAPANKWLVIRTALDLGTPLQRRRTPMYHGHLAELLEKKGDIKEALAEYSAASALEPADKTYIDAVKKLSAASKTSPSPSKRE